jgi:hypothetical protein
MSCCGGIVKGYGNLIRGKKPPGTDAKIRVCQKCEKNYWIKKTLWCSICKCFVPAKARSGEKCPLRKWELV